MFSPENNLSVGQVFPLLQCTISKAAQGTAPVKYWIWTWSWMKTCRSHFVLIADAELSKNLPWKTKVRVPHSQSMIGQYPVPNSSQLEKWTLIITSPSRYCFSAVGWADALIAGWNSSFSFWFCRPKAILILSWWTVCRSYLPNICFVTMLLIIARNRGQWE